MPEQQEEALTISTQGNSEEPRAPTTSTNPQENTRSNKDALQDLLRAKTLWPKEYSIYRPPRNLLAALSSMASDRENVAIHERERRSQLNREHYYQTVTLPRLRKTIDEEWEWHMQRVAKERFHKYLVEWRRVRDMKRGRNQLSREEVFNEIWEMVDEVKRSVPGGRMLQLWERGLETRQEVEGRVDELEERIVNLWGMNIERVEGETPRYVEGVPVRDGGAMWPPRIWPHRRQRQTGLEGCLGCEVQGLWCSRGWDLRKGCRRYDEIVGDEDAVERKRCRRCERRGALCCVRVWEGDGDDEDDDGCGWDVGGEADDRRGKWVFLGPGVTETETEPEPESESEEQKWQRSEEQEWEELMERYYERGRGLRREVVGGGVEVVEVRNFVLPRWGGF